ncbi:MAG: cyclic lactone autoinducer peptide [Lachnospiraceae bacterium]
MCAGIICFERGDKRVKRLSKKVKKAMRYVAKKAASIDANTVCPCLNYQPCEPDSVKKLRKF